MDRTHHEMQVGDYYDDIWKEFVRWWCSEETLGLHYAYYEKGITSFKQAVYNMNELIGRLLDLHEKKPKRILDAGCGVGGTSIYLATKYPKSSFTGLSVTPGQIVRAKQFSKQRHVKNTQFFLRSYLKSEFPDESFDGVFALESIGYSGDVKGFVDEMYRVLKPGGRLVVVDGLRTDNPMSPLMKKFYDDLCLGRGFLDVPVLSEYVRLLKKKGFRTIEVNDISKNVSRSQLRSFVIGIPYYVYTGTKKIVMVGRYNPQKDFVNYSMGTAVRCSLMGFSHIIDFYTVAAVK